MSRDISAIGIETIDAQHMQLFKQVEDFIQAYENCLESHMVDSTLNFLESYVVEHFRAEEALQVSINYPKYHEHKTVHNSFVKDLAKLKNQINENGISPDSMKYFTDILVKWVLDHIGGMDMEFAAHYNSNPR